MIGSVALMLDKSFGMTAAAGRISDAMRKVFDDGYVTADLASSAKGRKTIATAEFGDRVVAALEG
jgi:isocitrate/isopropylmalate dehydrogenase